MRRQGEGGAVAEAFLDEADGAFQRPAVFPACPGVRLLPVQLEVMQAAFPGDFLLAQEDGLPDASGPVDFRPEDGTVRRGQQDRPREAGHVQVVEIGMILRILRISDHSGDIPVPDAILDRLQIVLPDGGGGADIRVEAFAPFGHHRLPVPEEGKLGEADAFEPEVAGMFLVEERSQRDTPGVRPGFGRAGEEVVGGQVAEEGNLRNGDEVVPDGVGAGGIRPAFLAARDGQEEQRKEESFG